MWLHFIEVDQIKQNSTFVQQGWSDRVWENNKHELNHHENGKYISVLLVVQIGFDHLEPVSKNNVFVQKNWNQFVRK